LAPEALAAARLDRLRALVRAQPRRLDVDDLGQPVVRGEVLAVSPDPARLSAARAAGFTVLRTEGDAALGVVVITLAPPHGLDARRAVAQLRRSDPSGTYDYNHIYLDAGGTGAAPTLSPTSGGGAIKVGLLDGGVDARHSAFTGVSVEQRAFAGETRPSAHGTATAALLGVGRGGRILAADVYGDGKAGGSASAIVAALGWMAASRAPVVNISLVGPPNAALAAAVRALTSRGCLLVAAVGNDGPAAPPLYPASYPEVIAVTGVDARKRLLPEAGQALHVDFAAQGGGLRAARPGGGAVSVRGTSFAAPIVAGRLAGLMAAPDPGQAARAVDRLAGVAEDLGAPGRDPTFGRGYVAAGR
jgi:subtilisin family serine protease